jgi:hypothetical protein
MRFKVAIVLAIALLASGCQKKDTPESSAPVTPPFAKQEPGKADPSVPKGVTPSPGSDGGAMQKPPAGQANDHSSPDFKGGGPADPKK